MDAGSEEGGGGRREGVGRCGSLPPASLCCHGDTRPGPDVGIPIKAVAVCFFRVKMFFSFGFY